MKNTHYSESKHFNHGISLVGMFRFVITHVNTCYAHAVITNGSQLCTLSPFLIPNSSLSLLLTYEI